MQKSCEQKVGGINIRVSNEIQKRISLREDFSLTKESKTLKIFYNFKFLDCHVVANATPRNDILKIKLFIIYRIFRILSIAISIFSIEFA